MIQAVRRAAAIVCLLACGAFVVLWMRSLRWRDSYYWALENRTTVLRIDAYNGSFQMARLGDLPFAQPTDKPILEPGRSVYSERITDENRWEYDVTKPPFHGGFIFHYEPKINHIALPYWFLTLVSGAIGTVLCMKRPYRFSLRAALIATMLAAAVLGLGVAVQTETARWSDPIETAYPSLP